MWTSAKSFHFIPLISLLQACSSSRALFCVQTALLGQSDANKTCIDTNDNQMSIWSP
uniref:Lipoprotein n=1 Tax=Anguilla anguilla TaxID=7936 RepID=A0A0E9TL87_ANGAN